MAIWRLNGFRIHAHIAEKQGTLLFSGTFGHTVGSVALICSDHEITASPQVPIVACMTDINYPNAYLPGHSWELQLRLVVDNPVHLLPPCSAG